MPSISIREVALRAGVSRSTVSRVLNSNTEALVADHTRVRVRNAARELGYHPSAVARGLAGKPMYSIGVIMAYDLASVTSDPYMGPLLDGILAANKQHHQKTVLFTEDDWDHAVENLPIYCDGHCDGLLLISPAVDSPIMAILQEKGTPFVRIGATERESDTSLIEGGAREAMAGQSIEPVRLHSLREVGVHAVEMLLTQIYGGFPSDSFPETS